MPDRRGVSVIRLLWAVTFTAIAVFVMVKVTAGNKGKSAAGVRTAAGAAAGNANGLDPAPYREMIEGLEHLLYQQGTPDMSTASQVETRLFELGTAVMRGAGRGNSAGQQITALGSNIGSESDVGYAAMDLPRARQRWEEIRNDVFRPADWFQGATAGLTEAQTLAAAAAPVAPADLVNGLQTAASNVGFLIRTGRRALQSYGEVGVDVPARTPEAQQLAQRFRAWSTSWTDQINNVRRTIPTLPSNAERNLADAWQELDRATCELNEIPRTMNPYGVPSRVERDAHFANAESMVENARRYLAAVGGG